MKLTTLIFNIFFLIGISVGLIILTEQNYEVGIFSIGSIAGYFLYIFFTLSFEIWSVVTSRQYYNKGLNKGRVVIQQNPGIYMGQQPQMILYG